LKEAYRFEEEKLKAHNKSKNEVIELPTQRATDNPELQMKVEEEAT
jgi:hypothetical protein